MTTMNRKEVDRLRFGDKLTHIRSGLQVTVMSVQHGRLLPDRVRVRVPGRGCKFVEIEPKQYGKWRVCG